MFHIHIAYTFAQLKFVGIRTRYIYVWGVLSTIFMFNTCRYKFFEDIGKVFSAHMIRFGFREWRHGTSGDQAKMKSTFVDAIGVSGTKWLDCREEVGIVDPMLDDNIIGLSYIQYALNAIMFVG